MSNPLVSVLLSTYNRLDLLKICFDSIANQTYANLDIVIFNDCSTDGTKDFLDSLKDTRLNIFNSPENIVQKYGHTKVWLKMLELSKGDLIINISDDDYWPFKGFLKECVDKFREYKNLSKVIGNQVDYNYTEGEFQKFNYKEILDKISQKKTELVFHDNMPDEGLYKSFDYLNEFANRPLDLNISTSGTMFEKNKFMQVNALFNKNLSKYQGGYELLIPSSFLGDIYFINQPRVVVGLNSKNLSFNKTQIEHLEDSILAVNNAVNTVGQNKKFKYLDKDLKKFKRKIISNIVNTYLSHSIIIIKNKKLSLCTDENIKEYLNLTLYFKLIIKYKSYPKLNYIIYYITEKYLPEIINKNLLFFYNIFLRIIKKITKY